MPVGLAVARAALRGSQLPSTDEVAIAKAKAAEREARQVNPFKRAVAQVMRPIQHGAKA